MTAHIKDRLKDYFSRNGWIYAEDVDGSIFATRSIIFAHLAATVTDGERLVQLFVDPTGRWLECRNGFGVVEADVDLRDFTQAPAFDAVRAVVNKAFGADW